MAASSSSASLFGFREEDPNQMNQQQHSLPPSSATAAPAAAAAATAQKKKRNQPGTPNPDAEVIALSPKTLMATNRFICEVCNKGFQREQNLQLHRRGHNLPWKLKQKTTKEPKRKVYLCPEPTCVHHDPSRALGDLTGIKKHFSRKHGEKKWKCDKCSKKYAVQSDWKAHSKTCGTREYRCDCGTLFSRRDSFITHRAFCDALAQEGPRQPPITLTGAIGSHLFGSGGSGGGGGNNNSMDLNLSQVAPQMSNMQHQHDHHSNSATEILRLGAAASRTGQFDHHNILQSTFRPNSFFNNSIHEPNQNYIPDQGLMMQQNNNNSGNSNNLFNIPNFLSSNSTTNTNSSNNSFSEHLNMNNEGTNFFTGSGGTSSAPSLFSNCFPQGGGNSSNNNINAVTSISSMSATALLQIAAQMGATSSNGNGTTATSLLKNFGNNTPATNSASSGGVGVGAGASAGVGEHNRVLQMGGGSVNYGFGGANNEQTNLQDLMNSFAATGNTSIFETGRGGLGLGSGGADSSQLTRDFLGVGEIVRNMSGVVGGQREQQQNHQHQHAATAFNLPTSMEGDQRNIHAAQSFGGGGRGGAGGGTGAGNFH
ncbi:hypothetical protein RYX36_021617 [Vicia faba]